MSDLTEKCGDKAASLHWKETACRIHEDEMISILRKACFPDEGNQENDT